jgi:single-strand DNA-binding protein
MGNLNKAMLIGRLGADPEVRYTQSNTAVATLSLATSEKYKDANGEMQESTEWHRVIAWGRLAEIVQQYTKKGSQLYVEGPIQTRAWEDRDGQKRYTTEIKALVIQLLDPRDSNSGSGPSSRDATMAGARADSGPDLNSDDEDLPF